MANDRILQGKTINLPQYLDSVLNLTEILTKNLVEKLEKENRYSGLAKSYIHSMWDAFSYTTQEITDEEYDIFCRVLWLMKKTLTYEYNSLIRVKNLSEGDSIVVLLKRTFEILLEKAPEDWEYLRRVRTLLKLVDKFFDNIRNKKKFARLFTYTDTLKGYMERGLIGKRGIENINLPSSTGVRGLDFIEVLSQPGERLGIGGETKIIGEVSW